MTQQPCPNCPHLQAEVARLQAENTRLQIEVAMLLRIIGAARHECIALATEADKTMSGHVARGVWAYANGQGKAARRVLEKLGGVRL